MCPSPKKNNTRKSKKKILNEELLKSEERWKFALEGSGDGLWDWDAQTNKVYFSSRWKSMLGYEDHEIGDTLDEWDSRVHPEDKEYVYKEIDRHFSGETPFYTSEHRVRCKDGTYKWILDRGKVISRTEDGKPLRVIGTHTDISERKRAQEELQAKTEELDRYFTSSLDMLCIADTDGYFHRLNPEWEKVLGYSLSELIGRKFLDFVHPDDLEATLKAISNLERQEEVLGFENRYRCKDGSYCWIEWRSYPQGKMIYATARNITRRKQAEEAMRQSEENFSTFFNTINDFLFVLDMNGNILMVNDTVVNRLGYSREELAGKNLLMVHPADRQSEAGEIIQNILKGKETSCAIPIMAKSGKLISVETRVVMGRWNNQDVIFGVSKDISDIMLSEEKFSKIFHASGALIALTAFDGGRFIDVNEMFLKTLGYTREEVIGKTSIELGIFVDLSERDAIRREVKEKGKVRDFELRVLTKNNEIRHLLLSAEPIHVQDELYLLSTSNDITKIREAEKALRESEERYRNIFENAMEGIFQTTPEGCFINVNPAMAIIHGFESPSEMMATVTDIGGQLYVNPEDREKYRAILAQQGMISNYEAQVYRKDRSIIWTSTSARAIKDSKGRTLYHEGIVQDITMHKKAEDEKLYSTKLQSALEMAGTVCHELNQPLQIMSGYIDLLSMKQIQDAQISQKLETIKEQINRMGVITKKLMGLKVYSTRDYIGKSRIVDINHKSETDAK